MKVRKQEWKMLVQGQDYIFVRQFIPFTASVIIKSCKHSDEESDMQVLLSGISSLNDEISWFKTQAQNWDVHLHSLVPLQANLNYCKYSFFISNFFFSADCLNKCVDKNMLIN